MGTPGSHHYSLQINYHYFAVVFIVVWFCKNITPLGVYMFTLKNNNNVSVIELTNVYIIACATVIFHLCSLGTVHWFAKYCSTFFFFLNVQNQMLKKTFIIQFLLKFGLKSRARVLNQCIDVRSNLSLCILTVNIISQICGRLGHITDCNFLFVKSLQI